MNFRSNLSIYDRVFDDSQGYSIVENSADEIRDLAVEMLDTLDGAVEYTKEDDQLQEAFRALLDTRHYTYGAPARIGRNFLRQNAHLLNAGPTMPVASASEAT